MSQKQTKVFTDFSGGWNLNYNNNDLDLNSIIYLWDHFKGPKLGVELNPLCNVSTHTTVSG